MFQEKTKTREGRSELGRVIDVSLTVPGLRSVTDPTHEAWFGFVDLTSE